MGYQSCTASTIMPLIRPKLLVETARIGAGLYRRDRDLAATMSQVTSARGGALVSQLCALERQCEELRRRRSAAYRPGKHVQILSALIAEANAGTDDEADREAGSGRAGPCPARTGRMATKTKRCASGTVR